MHIEKVNVHQVLLPFKLEFSHSRKKGFFANNIIVEVLADHGEIKGYGEGAPRPYVTGESQESASRSVVDIINQDDFPWDLNEVSQIWDFVNSLPGGKGQNAAVCALEMALLDILGKSQDLPIMEYFSKDFLTTRICYDASIPLADNQQIIKVCKMISNLKISQLRIKMGKELERNREAIETVHSVFGNECDLRVDVNGAWDRDLAFRHIQLLEEYKVRIVEQPMEPGDPDIVDFASAMKARNMTLMADESACSLRDVERILEEKSYEMVNVRLSKCGGFRNSLRIIDCLRANGLTFQIGCQLGESGILSSAGRVLCLLCRDALYYDGSYDGLLLKGNITIEDVSFGPGGEATRLDGPGLGVNVNDQNMKRLSINSESVSKN